MQLVGALLEAVPDDHKEALMRDFLGQHPTNLKLRRVCSFPDQAVKFRAFADYGGKPWFDYCWLRVADDQPGAEPDVVDPTEKRMLAQLWAFTKWKGKCYVFVELLQRVHREEGVRPHPTLRKYKYYVYKREGRLAHPFYAFDLGSIVATAVVFPDPDFEVGPTVVEKQILYVPSVAELMGSSSKLPSETFLPKPPDRVVVQDEEGREDIDEVEDSDQEEIDA